MENFNNLINMIKKVKAENEIFGIGFKEIDGHLSYGEMIAGRILKPTPLSILDKDNFCQNLYDTLTKEFKDELETSYSYSEGIYTLFIKISKKIFVFFPNDNKYQKWIYNHIHKEDLNILKKHCKRIIMK